MAYIIAEPIITCQGYDEKGNYVITVHFPVKETNTDTSHGRAISIAVDPNKLWTMAPGQVPPKCLPRLEIMESLSEGSYAEKLLEIEEIQEGIEKSENAIYEKTKELMKKDPELMKSFDKWAQENGLDFLTDLKKEE